MLRKSGVLLVLLAAVAGCADSKLMERARKVNSEHELAEPNDMQKGGGIFTGKKGHLEIYSEPDDSVEQDPTKPRKVRRR